MSCEIHDDQWHCFLQEGEMVHIKREEWKSGEMEPVEVIFPEGDPKSGHPSDEYGKMVSRFIMDEIEFKPATPESYNGKKQTFKGDFEPMPEIKPNGKIWGFNPFGKIWDILNGEG